MNTVTAIIVGALLFFCLGMVLMAYLYTHPHAPLWGAWCFSLLIAGPSLFCGAWVVAGLVR